MAALGEQDSASTLGARAYQEKRKWLQTRGWGQVPLHDHV